MAPEVGFTSFARDWEGPVVLEFRHFREHTKTARYKCQLETRTFDLYAPLFMIPNLPSDARPERLLVALGRSSGPLRSIGFTGEARLPTVTSDTCEFDFMEQKVNSKRYRMESDGDSYSLYIPNEVFEGQPHPGRVYIRLGLPAEVEENRSTTGDKLQD